MGKLTKKSADEGCYRLWDWCSKNPSKEKAYWPEWRRNGGTIERVKYECFYCGYYRILKGGCGKCPLNLVDKLQCEYGSIFNKWETATTPYMRKKYALIIRDVAGERLGYKE